MPDNPRAWVLPDDGPRARSWRRRAPAKVTWSPRHRRPRTGLYPDCPTPDGSDLVLPVFVDDSREARRVAPLGRLAAGHGGVPDDRVEVVELHQVDGWTRPSRARPLQLPDARPGRRENRRTGDGRAGGARQPVAAEPPGRARQRRRSTGSPAEPGFPEDADVLVIGSDQWDVLEHALPIQAELAIVVGPPSTGPCAVAGGSARCCRSPETRPEPVCRAGGRVLLGAESRPRAARRRARRAARRESAREPAGAKARLRATPESVQALRLMPILSSTQRRLAELLQRLRCAARRPCAVRGLPGLTGDREDETGRRPVRVAAAYRRRRPQPAGPRRPHGELRPGGSRPPSPDRR